MKKMANKSDRKSKNIIITKMKKLPLGFTVSLQWQEI